MDSKDETLLKESYFDPKYSTAFSGGVKLEIHKGSWFKVNKATSL